MRFTRRNALIGLGSLVAGSGALVGTGAFTSSEAQRQVDVNVVTGEDINGIGDSEDAAAVADEFVDVRVDAGEFDSVFVQDSGGSLTASNLAPSDSSGAIGDVSQVSLIANEVTLVFGDPGSGLPPNSTINYDGLFVLDNADINGGGNPFDVTLSLSTPDSDNPFLDIDRNDSNSPSDGSGPGEGGGITMNGFNTGTDNGGVETLNSAVLTGEADDSLTLTITISS
jgi:hypothetical protein